MDDGGAYLALDVVAYYGDARVLELLSPNGIGGYEYRHAVDVTHPGIQGRLGVEPARLLRAYGHVVDENLGAAIFQLTHHVAGIEVGDDEGLVLFVRGHVRSDSVQNRPLLHHDPHEGDVGIEGFGAVWRGEDGIADVLSHLSFVDVEGRHHIYVAGAVSSDGPMHQPYTIFIIRIFIIFNPLDERAGAVAEAGNR